ncbi:hypothetical protein BDZ91DRAFT_710307 [Kalaharituber pfeilii]|nr:hypothetical protein BDZ91DRAFT_710307 [Kalaharituber pfeilii]
MHLRRTRHAALARHRGLPFRLHVSLALRRGQASRWFPGASWYFLLEGAAAAAAAAVVCAGLRELTNRGSAEQPQSEGSLAERGRGRGGEGVRLVPEGSLVTLRRYR